jgi:nucleoside-triphosphatase THEP1
MGNAGFELIDEAGPFEFYKKFFRKIKNILKTPGAAASYC